MLSDLNKALWSAARDGSLVGVNEALGAGAQVNSRGDYGDTALNMAAENGHREVVERLLEAGANIENLGGADKTPLMNAAFSGNVPIVQQLLVRGARINRDLLASLQMKVGILEENAEAGMVNPDAAAAWRRFFEYIVAKWQEQNSEPGTSVTGE